MCVFGLPGRKISQQGQRPPAAWSPPAFSFLCTIFALSIELAQAAVISALCLQPSAAQVKLAVAHLTA